MTFWHVSYFFKDIDKEIKPASAEIVCRDVFVPSEVCQHIARNIHGFHAGDGVTIFNWKSLELNQLSQELYERYKDDE